MFGIDDAILVGAGTSILGSALDFVGGQDAISSAKDRMADQAIWNRSNARWSARHMPTFEVEGLKRAGIHPYLRYGKGGSPVPFAQPGVSIPSPVNPYSGAASHLARASASAFGAAEAESRIEKQEAEIDKIGQEIKESSARISKMDVDKQRTKQEIKESAVRIGNILTDTALKIAQGELTVEQNKLVRANIKKLGVETLGLEIMNMYHSYQVEGARLGMTQRQVDEWWSDTWWTQFWSNIVNPVMQNVPFVAPRPQGIPLPGAGGSLHGGSIGF